MNSKERVLAAAACQAPDRVPMDFSATPVVLERLRRELNASDHRELLGRLRVDIVDLRGVVDPVYRGPVPKEASRPDGTKQNFWGWRTRVVQSAMGPEEEFCDFPLAGAQSVEELAAHRWPSADWFDFTGFSSRLNEWSGHAIMASGASVWQHPTFLRGLENLLIDLAANPEIAGFLLDRFTEFYVEYFDRMFTAAKDRIDILRIADDLGTQSGLLFGSAMFTEFVAPRLRRLIAMAHSHEVKVMFHSCGSIVPFIDSLIELGVDILDPIQVSAANMDPQRIKDRFGSRLCLHGSIDTQHLLPRGTPSEVAATVRNMIRILGKNGGFILAPCHVLQPDVPTANILSLYETGFGEGASVDP
jgi:uroporphyrinogen decarboxylase